MDILKTGGPAFPVTAIDATGIEACGRDYDGLTIRDYFAARAMQAMYHGFQPASNRAPDIYAVCAREAYAVADAMLAARELSPK